MAKRRKWLIVYLFLIFALIATGIWYFDPTRVHFKDAAWARSWPDGRFSFPMAVQTDHEGNVYVAGPCNEFPFSFHENPTSWTKWQSPFSNFLVKLAPDGHIVWQREWSKADAYIYRLVISDSGDSYLTGAYLWFFDADPGPQETKLPLSSQPRNSFLICLDRDGNFKWSKTVEDILGKDKEGTIEYTGISDDTLVVAGSAHDERGSFRFITRADENGNFGEYQAIPPSRLTEIIDVRSTPEDLQLVYYCYILNLVGNRQKSFFGLLSSEGTTTVWQVDLDCYVRGIVADGSGDVYIMGISEGITDYDLDKAISSGQKHDREFYVAKFDDMGKYVWSRTWPAVSFSDYPFIQSDDQGNVYLMTGFKGTVDVDPGEGVDMRTANTVRGGYTGLTSSENSIVIKLDSEGDFLCAYQGTNNGSARYAMIDDDGDLVVTGYLRGWSPYNGGGYVAKIIQPEK